MRTGGWCNHVIHRWWSSCMHARAYVDASYVGGATMPHVGHTGPFKVPWLARYFCLKDCSHMHGPGTQKCPPCWLARIITHGSNYILSFPINFFSSFYKQRDHPYPLKYLLKTKVYFLIRRLCLEEITMIQEIHLVLGTAHFPVNLQWFSLAALSSPVPKLNKVLAVTDNFSPSLS